MRNKLLHDMIANKHAKYTKENNIGYCVADKRM